MEYILDEGFSSQFAYDSVLDKFGYETLEGRSFMHAYTRVALDASSQGAARLRGNTIPYASAACAHITDQYGHD